MERVLQAVLPVTVVVQATQDYRSTGAAACRGAIRVGEDGSVSGEGVQGRRLNYGISVASQGVGSMVVRDDQNDIGACGKFARGEGCGDKKNRKKRIAFGFHRKDRLEDGVSDASRF